MRGKAFGAVAGMLLVSGAAFGGIAGSAHDFSATTGGVTVDYGATPTNARTCVFCHTPHGAVVAADGAFAGPGAQGAALPLWNRSLDTLNTFTAYTNPNGTLTATILPLPTSMNGASFACFGCHDGTLALDDLKNFPNQWTSGTPADDVDFSGASIDVDESLGAGSTAMLGNDLSADHPVGFDYTLSEVDPGIKSQALAEGDGIVFPAGNVECASCHDVHDNTNGSFLRISNTNSALCTACHNK